MKKKIRRQKVKHIYHGVQVVQNFRAVSRGIPKGSCWTDILFDSDNASIMITYFPNSGLFFFFFFFAFSLPLNYAKALRNKKSETNIQKTHQAGNFWVEKREHVRGRGILISSLHLMPKSSAQIAGFGIKTLYRFIAV